MVDFKLRNEFKSKIYTTGIGDDKLVPRCERCFPKANSSVPEKEIVEFVKSIYNGQILENQKGVINGKMELDIYLPEKKLAIEFDGLFWHSEEQGKNSEYHLAKTLECEKNGIRLLHVFEDEWTRKREIVEDRIKSALGIQRESIPARKCVVEKLSSRVANAFLQSNHLQGGGNSTFRYGLFYKNELVAVMTFGKPRFDKKHDWEMVRFATKIGTRVVGGASKLLAHFTRDVQGSIVSYADRRYSDGNLYLKLGFRMVGISEPNYWYVRGMEKFSRYQCQKHRLKQLLGDNFDSKKSERENMLSNGYHLIYDCGNLIFELVHS